jgi:hypothetical protein
MKQSGYGMPVFTGASYQRGYGLGHVMKNIVRTATPILKEAGKQALKTGISVIASGVVNKRKRKSSKRVIRRRTPIRVSSARKRQLKNAGFVGFSPLNQKGSGRGIKRKATRGTSGKKKRSRKMKGDIFSYK